MSDDPTRMIEVAAGMGEFLKGKNAITSPWWAVGAAVEGLTQVAADEENPLAGPALVALEVMASIYNEKMGVR